ncbi:MAG TPA: hypothetical protein PKX17_03950, partial [Candidatus Methanomethylicus sp.]|nr:hypothetical protein [Candidatus Methanomethylicus sp.]
GAQRRAPPPGVRWPLVHGATLVALASGRFDDASTAAEAKRLMREVLDHHLESRTIASRRVVRDLQALEEEVNASGGGKVEVVGLKYSDKKRVRSLKEKAKVAEKVYRALVELGCAVPEGALRKLEKSFKGGVINQLTPNRVLHRRADKLRLKKVHEMTARAVGDRMIELVVRCQGGLYVKELISGDEGRTTPCVADVIGCSARCVELDVIAVNEGA